jgi:hypothetical protein
MAFRKCSKRFGNSPMMPIEAKTCVQEPASCSPCTTLIGTCSRGVLTLASRRTTHAPRNQRLILPAEGARSVPLADVTLTAVLGINPWAQPRVQGRGICLYMPRRCCFRVRNKSSRKS